MTKTPAKKKGPTKAQVLANQKAERAADRKQLDKLIEQMEGIGPSILVAEEHYRTLQALLADLAGFREIVNFMKQRLAYTDKEGK